jgi:hypothetical protein
MRVTGSGITFPVLTAARCSTLDGAIRSRRSTTTARRYEIEYGDYRVQWELDDNGAVKECYYVCEQGCLIEPHHKLWMISEESGADWRDAEGRQLARHCSRRRTTQRLDRVRDQRAQLTLVPLARDRAEFITRSRRRRKANRNCSRCSSIPCSARRGTRSGRRRHQGT